MALWFSGASAKSAPRDFREGTAPTGKSQLAQRFTSHLDVGTLAPTNGGKPHGKGRNEAVVATRGTIEELLYCDASTASHSKAAASVITPTTPQPRTPRQAILRAYGSHLDADLQPSEPRRVEGVRIFKNNTSLRDITPIDSVNQSTDSAAAFCSSPPPKPSAPPFASDANNVPAVPYVGMRRKLEAPHPTSRLDGDAFVLKRSRTPPPGSKFKETTSEGFGVLLASSLKSRANPQMIPASHYGKLASQKAEASILAARQRQEDMVEQAVRDKSMRAYAQERERVAQHQQPQRSSGRSRCMTPPPSTSCPFALNFPVPRDTVGKRMSVVHSPRRWVR